MWPEGLRQNGFMKICILQVLHTPNDKRVFHKEAKTLAAAGHEVLSIVPSEETLPAVMDGVHIQTYRVGRGMKGRFVALLKLVPKAWQARADVYLCVEPETWVTGLIVKALTGRKVIFDQHEHVPSKFADKFPRGIRGLIQRLTVQGMRIMARFTDQILLTKACLDEAYTGLPTPRTIVLNTNHLRPPCASVPSELAAKYVGRPVIIHQGLFGDVRGSYQLLEAITILVGTHRDLKCILLGKYIYGDEQAYRDAIQEAGLGHVIDLYAEIPFDEVPPYIALSKVGLVLFQPGPMNHTLAMPHKMFDYMREEVPLIAPAFAVEVNSIISAADCGLLVDVSDPVALAKAIAYLLEHPEEARRLGENGRKAVETTYHWENDARKLLDVFDAVKPAAGR